MELLPGGILAEVGGTPLVRLRRIESTLPFRVFAKLEGFNPGGSIKDRAAVQILFGALQRGEVGITTTIVESSSGNMGIGLALACKYLGLSFICVVDHRTSALNLALLRAYGAHVEVVEHPDPLTGDLLTARLNRVAELVRSTPDAYWPNQYGNLDNSRAHHTTMAEISAKLENKIDFLFCPTSTCGTIRGCAEYIKKAGLGTQVWAVDAVGSVIFGSPPAKRLLPGHGAGRRPELLNTSLVDRCVHVSDFECVIGCRRLLQNEAIMAGASSGGVLTALEKMRDSIPAGSVCVGIFPDRGERYLDTIYCDTWVKNNFADEWVTKECVFSG